MIKKPELLAPAGNILKMKTAFAFGANAVYLGVPDFSLRVRINDFTIEKIKKAVDYAHQINKKAYVTINIFARDSHIKKLPQHIEKLKKINPDGIFISDPGVLGMVKKNWPEVKLVLSTQANCTNSESARFWKTQGCERVILSRELSLEEIKEIHKQVPGVELECFVHGALCMAYSGRCFLSKYHNDRDANLGDCSQPCRWDYKTGKTTIITEGHEELELYESGGESYILNSKDLCLIKRIPEIINAGISAFKIEGRAKSVYYLANVVGAYRQAIDLIAEERRKGQELKKQLEFLFEELKNKTYNRGFTEGFMFSKGQEAQNLDSSHNDMNWEFCGQVIKSKKLSNKKYQNFIKVHNTLKVGDALEIVEPGYEITKLKLLKMKDAETGENISQAHGGAGGKTIIIELDRKLAKYSVLRRKIA